MVQSWARRVGSDFSKLKDRWRAERVARVRYSSELRRLVEERALPVLRRYGVRKASLFGCVSAGTAVSSPCATASGAHVGSMRCPPWRLDSGNPCRNDGHGRCRKRGTCRQRVGGAAARVGLLQAERRFGPLQALKMAGRPTAMGACRFAASACRSVHGAAPAFPPSLPLCTLRRS